MTFYGDGQRALQQQFETRRMADLPEQVIVHRDMFFLATVDAAGQPTCSYKGGDPGFVKVVDPTTILSQL